MRKVEGRGHFITLNDLIRLCEDIMAEETPTTPDPKPIPKAAAPPGAGGPPKAAPPPGAGGPPKAAPPPGAGGPPKAAAPPGAGGPPKAALPPGAGGPPKAAAPPGAGGPPRAAVPPGSAAPAAVKPTSPPAATKGDSASYATELSVVTRREFLNYVWAGSMALLLAGTGGISFYFALPRPRLGEFGGVIPVSADEFRKSATDAAPIANNVGKFWISNTEKGIVALYKVCTHLGCIYPWSASANRFQCPCHGSQFHMDGTYIAGPAPRNLDRFMFEIFDASGASLSKSENGDPIPLPDNAASIKVDTGKKTQGKGHF